MSRNTEREKSFPTIEEAKKKVQESPDSLEANALLGELLYGAERFTDAISPLTFAAEKLVQETASSKEKGMYKGFQVGMVIVSEEQLRVLAYSIMMKLGHALYHINEKGKAKHWFAQALEAKDDDPDSWNLYAVTLGETDCLNEALVAFREAVRANPSRHDLWKNLQVTYGILQRPETQSITPVLTLKRDIEDDIAILIDLFIQGAQYDRAHELIDLLTEWDSNDIRAMRGLGRLHIIENAPEKAIECSEAQLKHTPNDAGLLWNLARAKCLVGKRKDSKKISKNLLKLKKSHTGAQALIEAIKAGGGKHPMRIGIILLLKHEISTSEGEEESIEKMNEIVYYADLNPPLGSTVEDLIHILRRKEVARLTEKESLKRINLTTIHRGNTINMLVSGLPGTGYEFEYFEPGSKIVQFQDTDRRRRMVHPVENLNDILVSGDIVALISCENFMQENLQIVAWYRTLMERAQQKLNNWHW